MTGCYYVLHVAGIFMHGSLATVPAAVLVDHIFCWKGGAVMPNTETWGRFREKDRPDILQGPHVRKYISIRALPKEKFFSERELQQYWEAIS